MPEMTGFEVLDKLKSDPLTRNIPVAICTSRVLTLSERRLLMGQAIAILSKETLAQTGTKQMLLRTLNEVGLMPNAG